MSRRTDAASTETWEHRHDRGELLASRSRADGTLLVEGFAAREGVLEYRRADGSIRRELVPAETLRDSAKGLARAPVTLEHPGEDVSPDNVGALGVGDVDGEVLIEDGGFVRVRMAVRRRDAIEAVRKGKRELSPGYRVRLDETPGTHPVYGRYDAVQVARTYNHLAIVDRARGGSEVRLRADAAEAVSSIRAPAGPPNTQRGTMNARMVALLAFLGVTQRVDSDDAALDAALDALKARKDASDTATRETQAAIATLTQERDAQKARADQAERDRDAQKARADGAEADAKKLREADAARKDAALRAELEELAKGLRVDASKHEKTADLKRAVAAAHLGTEIKADATDAYLDAVIDLAKADGRKAGTEAWTSANGTRGDAAGNQRKGRKSPSQLQRENIDRAFQAGRNGGEA